MKLKNKTEILGLITTTYIILKHNDKKKSWEKKGKSLVFFASVNNMFVMNKIIIQMETNCVFFYLKSLCTVKVVLILKVPALNVDLSAR